MATKPGKKEIVYAELKNSIEFNEYPSGRLPTEKELATRFDVAQGTLRHALDRLEKEGLIERIRKRGTFVKAPTEPGNKRRLLCITHSHPSNIDNPFRYVQPGMEHEAKRHGYEIVTIDYEQIEGMPSAEFNQIFSPDIFNGILLGLNVSALVSNPLWKEVKIPTVAVHALTLENMPENIGVVGCNPRECWRMALAHLLERGHRRIACLTSIKNEDIRGMSEDEYFNLLKANSADHDRNLLFRTLNNKQEIIAATNRILNLPSLPTALLCFSDFFAIHVYEALKSRGYRVPDDLAVMGTCGYPGGEFLSPPLSTVDYRYFDSGVAAVGMLLESTQWFGGTGPRIIIPGKLIERASTALKRAELRFAK